MPSLICPGCRSTLRRRLQAAISIKEFQRRRFHPDPISQSSSRLTQTTSASYSVYKDTTPPSHAQLEAARRFFQHFRPHKLWTGYEWQKPPPSSSPSSSSSSPSTTTNQSLPTLLPEIAFLGRSNVGKSSLLNALLNTPNLNYVGAKAGKTQTIHAWALAPALPPKPNGKPSPPPPLSSNKLALLDMPGYGHRSHAAMGSGIMKYLESRTNLRRVFLIIDAQHGVKQHDVKMLDLLQHLGVSYQVILGKCDRLIPSMSRGRPETTLAEAIASIERVLEPLQGKTGSVLNIMDMIAVAMVDSKAKHGSKTLLPGGKSLGVAEVQWAVLRAVGLEEYAMHTFGGVSDTKKLELGGPTHREGYGLGMPGVAAVAEQSQPSTPLSQGRLQKPLMDLGGGEEPRPAQFQPFT